MVSIDQYGVVTFYESYVLWSWRRGQIDKFHNSALPLTVFWLSWEILSAISTEKRDILQFLLKALRAPPLEETSLWSILFEFFQRSGASFDTILENVSGWLPGSTPTIFSYACPSHGLMVTLELDTSATSTNRRDRCAPAHP
jgi:hypothetical protein